MLTVDIESWGDELAVVIRLPYSTLSDAVQACPRLDSPSIRDEAGFAGDVVRALRREEEDGTTPVHRLFDAAFEEAVEEGSIHIAVAGDEEWECDDD